ncbi:A/G-specific adenine glycosylase [Commensalibacter oyaizuii]|uniref:Adenine DNA glycosylase n=1 Tax=Commensalibacter oyaizuii TaxID=3043873 RepID=A0ABT6Q3P2_9PROT|nr:A/G-specific adenine glycosylase [Commensalibacter sp. TBRC 16381]MDI2091744.1 A/G-specific adenine glycosylase [Commensalibacter sp. TBRC 16381]
MSTNSPYADLILHWYDHHQRILPWRAKKGEAPNPYHVLLSEIMLQQTQVATVIPYFNRFIQDFPTICDLAKASLDHVMSLWTGLGYYSRARNLHQCAQQIVDQGGNIPTTINELKKLSGIGDYTAAAIYSIGFNQPAVPVDGNVERITARLFAIKESLPAIKPKLASLAKMLNQGQAAQERPGDFAQGLFDIGATICKPKNPLCLLCPLSAVCKACLDNIANDLPKRSPKAAKPIKYGISFFIQGSNNNVLFHKRPMKGVLAGTWQLPSTSWEEKVWDLPAGLKQMGYTGDWEYIGDINHVFTHFILKISLYKPIIFQDSPINAEGYAWYNLSQLDKYPCSSLMKKAIDCCL